MCWSSRHNCAGDGHGRDGGVYPRDRVRRRLRRAVRRPASEGLQGRRQTGGQRWPAPAARGTATDSTWRTSTIDSTSTPSRSRTEARDGALSKLASMLKRHAADSMPGFELLDQPVRPALENVVSEPVASGYVKHGKLTEEGQHEAFLHGYMHVTGFTANCCKIYHFTTCAKAKRSGETPIELNHSYVSGFFKLLYSTTYKISK